ncbi:succinate dehydrogenase cytochrome b subunit [Bacteroidota bacterium]
MGWIVQSFTSSIGKKILMALTGTLLLLFLMYHFAGNLTIYFGREVFTTYVETLSIFKPIVRVIEVILALIFLSHIVYAIWLWIQNKKARPGKYAVNASSENSSFSSRITLLTGLVILIFLLTHLQTIWYVFNFSPEKPELWDIMVYWFSNPNYSGFYVLAMILLGYHLNHGFQSAFQTFGWNHSKYFPIVKTIGWIYTIVIAAGFASMPIYFLFFYGGN